jgi:glutathione S-transferase
LNGQGACLYDKAMQPDRQTNRLYHYPLSPFCRKVRLTLAEKRIEVELVEERYWEQEPDFLRRNPAGKVPVLKHGQPADVEIQAICEFLEETVPTPPLMPRDPDARYEVRRLCLVRRQVPRRCDRQTDGRTGQPQGDGHRLSRQQERQVRGAGDQVSTSTTCSTGFWISAAGWPATT